jgi:alpha-L-fucosidase
VNGDAVYGTRIWNVQHEGDVYFTNKGEHVFAIFLKWQGEEFRLKSVRPVENSKITMLGVPGDLKWRWDSANGLTISYPKEKARPTQCSYAWAFKIKIK